MPSVPFCSIQYTKTEKKIFVSIVHSQQIGHTHCSPVYFIAPLFSELFLALSLLLRINYWMDGIQLRVLYNIVIVFIVLNYKYTTVPY